MAPRLTAPPGACDCHMHIYERRFPEVATRPFPSPEAPVSAYLAMRRALGFARSVVVQPAAYGTDNSCTLKALRVLGPSARGVAVVDTTVTDSELERLTVAGVRGIRFLMLPGGVLPWEILETMAARVHAFGWHVQLQMNGRHLPDREALLFRLPGTLVIDHTGKFIDPAPPDHPGVAVLRRLLDRGRTWIKLSAPYETSKAGPPEFGDVGAIARVLVGQAPERLVWGSNWPHPGAPRDKVPDDGMLLDVLLDWVPDETIRNRILADNPARLYGFG